MRIALATCDSLLPSEVDDEVLARAFESRGVEVTHPNWDEPSFDWGACDACLIRTTWDYMDRREEFVTWAGRVSSELELFNPASVVRWNTDKSYLRELEEDGIAGLPTVWLARGETPDLARLLREREWPRAFLKPTVGASASGTLRFDASDEGLAAAMAHLDQLLPTQEFMLQPYMSSVESAGELSAIFVDGVLTHGVRKVPVPGDYRVQDDYGASDEPYSFSRAERELACRVVALAAERLGERDLLYGRVDFLRDDVGRLLLNELELVEPSMFFRHAPQAAVALADGLLARL